MNCYFLGFLFMGLVGPPHVPHSQTDSARIEDFGVQLIDGTKIPVGQEANLYGYYDLL